MTLEASFTKEFLDKDNYYSLFKEWLNVSDQLTLTKWAKGVYDLVDSKSLNFADKKKLKKCVDLLYDNSSMKDNMTILVHASAIETAL